MNAQELRIGNFAKHINGLEFFVLSINKSSIKYSINGSTINGTFPIDQVVPITLTEEWLLNLGIEKTT